MRNIVLSNKSTRLHASTGFIGVIAPMRTERWVNERKLASLKRSNTVTRLNSSLLTSGRLPTRLRMAPHGQSRDLLLTEY